MQSTILWTPCKPSLGAHPLTLNCPAGKPSCNLANTHSLCLTVIWPDSSAIGFNLVTSSLMGSAPPLFGGRRTVVGQNVRDTNHAKIDMTRLTCLDLLGLLLLFRRRWCYWCLWLQWSCNLDCCDLEPICSRRPKLLLNVGGASPRPLEKFLLNL